MTVRDTGRPSVWIERGSETIGSAVESAAVAQGMRSGRWRRSLTAPLVAAMVVAPLATVGAARAGVPVSACGPGHAVAGWVARHAAPLRTTSPTGPVGELAPLRGWIGNAAVVGLGESVHGAADELMLKHRVVRFLVERMGFRSIAWEEDWTMGLRLDRYLRTGRGDLAALVAQMSPQWPSREVADVLRWLRTYNVSHTDQVRFVGVDFYLVQPLAYDAVAAYVAHAAPRQLSAAQTHLRAIRPTTPDLFAYIRRFQQLPADDKRAHVRHARQLYRLVSRIPHRRGDRAHMLAVHHAQQILSFYMYYTLMGDAPNVYRDAQAAQNLDWWRRYTGGQKIIYWAASPHVAADRHIRIHTPGRPDLRFASVGWYLRHWYGHRYQAIGFSFDHGSISGGQQTITAPPPAPGWYEQPLGAVCYQQFMLNLHTPAPCAVRRWLQAPVKTRAPDAGPNAYVTGTSLGAWFDIIIHRQHVTPAHTLAAVRDG
jgi:erythromycin esterase-like protein